MVSAFAVVGGSALKGAADTLADVGDGACAAVASSDAVDRTFGYSAGASADIEVDLPCSCSYSYSLAFALEQEEVPQVVVAALPFRRALLASALIAG